MSEIPLCVRIAPRVLLGAGQSRLLLNALYGTNFVPGPEADPCLRLGAIC